VLFLDVPFYRTRLVENGLVSGYLPALVRLDRLRFHIAIGAQPCSVWVRRRRRPCRAPGWDDSEGRNEILHKGPKTGGRNRFPTKRHLIFFSVRR
jgi:hypothetical protein